MKRILSVLMAAALVASLSFFSAGAAEKLTPEETHAKVVAQAEALEQKYSIGITYPSDSDGHASITRNNLETLDLALSSLTPSFVKQVSNYYQQRNGHKIDFNFIFSNPSYHNGGVIMAAFERTTSKIYIFLPVKAGEAIISGENPIALVHEFGHAFHLMCADSYGERKMLAEWSEFNNGVGYDRNFGLTNPNESLFVSTYAATSYEEDVAETFAHAFVRSAPGTGFKNLLSKDSKMTGLGRKVNYVERMLSAYLTNSADAVANYRRIYETSTSMTYEGLRFSGDYLQYIGYPQPRNILKGMLNELDMTSQKTTWVRAIGAWRVIDDRGDMYFVFPGGSWSAAKAEKAA